MTLFVRYEVDGLPEESRRLVEEAGAYAYFCLTLLDIFGRPDDEGRLTEAGHREGQLELLATARQELSVSPHSARQVWAGGRVMSLGEFKGLAEDSC